MRRHVGVRADEQDLGQPGAGRRRRGGAGAGAAEVRSAGWATARGPAPPIRLVQFSISVVEGAALSWRRARHSSSPSLASAVTCGNPKLVPTPARLWKKRIRSCRCCGSVGRLAQRAEQARRRLDLRLRAPHELRAQLAHVVVGSAAAGGRRARTGRSAVPRISCTARGQGEGLERLGHHGPRAQPFQPVDLGRHHGGGQQDHGDGRRWRGWRAARSGWWARP